MPPDETLSAVVSATDNVSSTLEEIAEGFREVAAAAEATSAAARNAAGGLDEAEDEGSALARALNSVSGSAGGAAGGMGAVSGAAEGVESSADDAEDEVSDLNRELAKTAGLSTAAALGIAGVDEETGDMQLDLPHGSLGAEERAARQLVSDQEAEVDLDTSPAEESIDSVQSSIEEFRDDTLLEAENEQIDHGPDDWRAQTRRGEARWSWEAPSDRKISATQTAIDAFDDATGTAHLRAEGAEDVTGKTRAVNRAIRALDGEEAETRIEVDSDEAEGKLPSFNQRLENALTGRSIERTTDLAVGGVIDVLGQDEQKPAEIREGLYTIEDALREMPQFELDENEDVDEFSRSLQGAIQSSDDLIDQMGRMDEGDEIFERSETIYGLREELTEAEGSTRQARRAIDRLDGSGENLVETLVEGSNSTAEFRSNLERLEGHALQSSVAISDFDDNVSTSMNSAKRGSKTSRQFADKIEDVSDETAGAVHKMRALNRAVDGLGPSIADVSTHIAGFTTSLRTLARLTPMVLSLATALGGLATAGAAGLGAMGMMGAGGFLGLGATRGEQLAATPGDPEDMDSGPVKDAIEAESELARTMAGVEDIMQDVKQAAYDAMEPLRGPQMQQFTMGAIEGSLTLLHELAQLTSNLADHLTGVASSIANSFWTTWPYIVEELTLLIEDLFTGATISGAIEALPGIFASMREHGNDILPLLGEFMGALFDVLPSILKIGTAMLTVLIPAIEGVAYGLEWLAPVTEMLAGMLVFLGDKGEPVIEVLFEMMTILYGLSMMATTAITAVNGLVALMTGALGVITKFGVWLITAASGAGTLAKILTALGSALKLVVGFVGIGVSLLAGLALAVAAVITYFDLWDDILVGLIKTWNAVVGVFMGGASIIGNAIEGMVNTAIQGLNDMIKELNTLPMVNLDLLGEVEIDGAGAFDQHQIDPETGKRIGEKMNLRNRWDEDSTDPTPESEQGPGKPTSGGRGGRRGNTPQNSGTVVENQYINSSPQTDDAEIKRAARSAVEDANRKERRRNSPMN